MTEREIFFEALEMDTSEARGAYLQGACGRDVTLRRKVDELLKEHFSNDSLLAESALEGERIAVVESLGQEAPAQMIGRYKLLEKIGEGGFGEVWMAEQREPVKRRVALKIIKLGMDSRQIVNRFAAERQALAMMDHPNIAKIFDAGTTGQEAGVSGQGSGTRSHGPGGTDSASEAGFLTPDSRLLTPAPGRPYFVMELVRGIKITEYCDQNQLPTQERLRLFILVCQAIQHAHQKGIIHRDIKPSNILVTLHDGVPVPKVIDFGIAKATQQELTDKTVFTQFQQFIGTPAYISPEQAEMSGLDIDTRADIYSLGVLLYELLVGQTPFDAKEMMQGGLDALRQIIREKEPLRPSTKLSQTLVAADVRRLSSKSEIDGGSSRRLLRIKETITLLRGDLDWIVMKCLEKDRARRYETATGLATDIQRHLNNEAVLARPASSAYRFQKLVRRNKLAFGAVTAIAMVLVFGVIVSSWQTVRATRAERQQSVLRADAAKVRRAHEQVPEITMLAAEENYAAAFALAEQAEQHIPTDPALTNLWPRIAVSVSIATTPAGADVYLKEYKTPDANWRYLGKSPLNTLRIPRGFYRWQIKKDGYEIVERAKTPANGSMAFTLDLAGAIPAEMVRMSGRKFIPELWGVENLEPVELEDFLIDRFEVGNKRFKEFVDRGGYERTNYWKLPFIKDGKPISRAEAMTEFQDKTGRPGPASWVNGSFASGQGDYPVSGVSWYEAAAYAEFAGKSLPTLYHWYRAAGAPEVAEIIPFSNFGGQGPAPAGRHHGMSSSGAFDMAGNVGEWIWNEGESGKRLIAGGAWNDPSYMFNTLDAAAPLNRPSNRGFRCMKILSGTGPPQATVGPVIRVYRDYKTEKPVSDDVFRSFRGFYAYDKTALDSKIESTDESSPQWRKEKITFNAAYGNEKVIGYLFLPKKISPPYQTIIYFPAAYAIQERSSEARMAYPANVARWEPEAPEVILQSGRAFFYPVYKGTFERGIGLTTTRPNPMSAHRDFIIQVAKDFQRSVDYLETRKDIDRDRLGYLGVSWGARLGTQFLALEDRVKAGVLILGGLYMEKASPEVDQINFVTRVKVPILMLNGKYDPVFAVKESQIPMFQLLATPAKDKRHVLYELGHQGPSRNELEKEIPSWFDRYLGPVK